MQEDRRQRQEAREGGMQHHSRGQTLKLTTRHYWHRLLGTSLGWFAWDFYYVSLGKPLHCLEKPINMIYLNNLSGSFFPDHGGSRED